MATLQGDTGEWDLVIGMEIHAQVISNAKLFSGASTSFGADPNTQVSLVDAAMPGMLPVINDYCVRQAVKTGLALKAQINHHSVFDRKNYFYPDLPMGYQISQYHEPVVGEGKVLIDLPDGSTKEIGITRLHLEMDAGKSLHDQHPSKSYIDLNRSGVALMEIVSEPDMRSIEEAQAYINKIRTLLRYIEACDGNMAEGSMRADINISVRRPGEGFGTRTEVKNVNSVRFLGQAIQYEAQRQIEVIEAGGAVVQETRLYDPSKGETRSMRGKEEAHDYRYFPDPDLLPLELSDAYIEQCRQALPRLPDERKRAFVEDYGLSAYEAAILAAERERADYYEVLAKGRDARIAANWLITELLGALNKRGEEITESPVSADGLGELLDLMADETISGRIAKDVFADMIETGKRASAIVEEKGLKQITDTGELAAIADKVIAENSDKVEQYKAGKEKLFGFFVGQVMKATGGKANPQAVNAILKDKLG